MHTLLPFLFPALIWFLFFLFRRGWLSGLLRLLWRS